MNALSSYHQGTRHSNGWFEIASKERGPGTEEALAVFKLSVMLLLIYYTVITTHIIVITVIGRNPKWGDLALVKRKLN